MRGGRAGDERRMQGWEEEEQEDEEEEVGRGPEEGDVAGGRGDGT